MPLLWIRGRRPTRHLYRCMNEKMQECISTDLSSLNTKFDKEGLTTPVYTVFINAVCTAAYKTPLSNYEIEDEQSSSVRGLSGDARP